ncbi:EAL domain-containing protein [Pandoraea horticolens]|uniref:EAL domain-containing protein n=1 Tax=Pandoraea horticolens TaxID=2508298 RepID=UPI001583EF1E|nr:EAL domain-containing protein [Pandoraea horticolens]
MGIVLDLSQQVQVASRLWYVTHHDPVTRLPNPPLLNERLEPAIHRCARQQAGPRSCSSNSISSEMDAHAHRRNELESLLRVAVHEQARSQLHLVYQTQVSLANGEIRHAEALLRRRHPSLGAVGPAEFIPIAETAGLILPLGEWVMHAACREARRLLRRGGQLPRISVNVSAQQFARQDVVGMIGRALSAHALEPRYPEIEITETVLLGDQSWLKPTAGPS